MENEKKCSSCKFTLDREDFNKSSLNKDGIQNICRKCSSLKNKSLSKIKGKSMKSKKIKLGVKKGDIVTHNGKKVLVQMVLDYCPKLRKSYIKGCAIDNAGRPLLGVDVFVGYDWEILK